MIAQKKLPRKTKNFNRRVLALQKMRSAAFFFSLLQSLAFRDKGPHLITGYPLVQEFTVPIIGCAKDLFLYVGASDAEYGVKPSMPNISTKVNCCLVS